VKLKKLVNEYFEEKEMTKKCTRCNLETIHSYKFRIWDYPRILILHVDRFSETGLELRVRENAPMFGAK